MSTVYEETISEIALQGFARGNMPGRINSFTLKQLASVVERKEELLDSFAAIHTQTVIAKLRGTDRVSDIAKELGYLLLVYLEAEAREAIAEDVLDFKDECELSLQIEEGSYLSPHEFAADNAAVSACGAL